MAIHYEHIIYTYIIVLRQSSIVLLIVYDLKRRSDLMYLIVRCQPSRASCALIAVAISRHAIVRQLNSLMIHFACHLFLCSVFISFRDYLCVRVLNNNSNINEINAILVLWY